MEPRNTGSIMMMQISRVCLCVSDLAGALRTRPNSTLSVLASMNPNTRQRSRRAASRQAVDQELNANPGDVMQFMLIPATGRAWLTRGKPAAAGVTLLLESVCDLEAGLGPGLDLIERDV